MCTYDATFIGGKRICNSLAGSYELRTKIAIVQHNTDGHSGSRIEEFIFGKKNDLCSKMENARKRKCHKNSVAKETNPKEYTPDEAPNKKKKKRLYGDGHEDVDMTQSEFEVASSRFHQRLHENHMNRQTIQLETRAQHHSFKWTEVRRLMLTSSYFGRVLNVRSRKSYSNIVHEILYKNSKYANTAELRHQRMYETEGLSFFTQLYPHEAIHRCGIFIDEEIPFLGNIKV